MKKLWTKLVNRNPKKGQYLITMRLFQQATEIAYAIKIPPKDLTDDIKETYEQEKESDRLTP